MGRLPAVPPALKPLQMYLKTADDFDARDPMVAYYCRAYAAKIGISEYLNAGTKPFLLQLMDVVEQDKQGLTVTSEDAGQSALWNVALKLFKKADDEDRAGRANKKVAQAFYTAMVLFDVLRYFDELNEEEKEKHKYAKFKAAYISKCLKDGTVPVPGPMDNDGNPIDAPAGDASLDILPDVSGMTSAYNGAAPAAAAAAAAADHIPFPSAPSYPAPPSYSQMQQPPPSMPPQPQYSPSQPGSYPPAFHPPAQPQYPQQPQQPQYQQQPLPPQQPQHQYPPPQQPQQFQPPPQARPAPPQQQQQQQPQPPKQQTFQHSSGTFTAKDHVEIRDNEQAKKFCKFAISALEYNDTRTAVENLMKALKLLSN